MAQRTEHGDSTEAARGATGSSHTRAGYDETSLGAVARRLGFWSAIVLPFVALALLALQPTGWVPALLGVLAVDVGAVLVGHCHDREC